MTNTYYALRGQRSRAYYSFGTAYASPRLIPTGSGDVKTAERFATVADAAKAMGASPSYHVDIIRVEETTNSPARVITNRTKIDATKPCVVVVKHPSQTDRFATDTSIRLWTDDIFKAHVFNDLGDVLIAAANRNGTTWAFAGSELKVFNVEVVTAPPTITETILK